MVFRLGIVRNIHKIKVDFRYEFRFIHRQIFGTITRIAPKIWLV